MDKDRCRPEVPLRVFTFSGTLLYSGGEFGKVGNPPVLCAGDRRFDPVSFPLVLRLELLSETGGDEGPDLVRHTDISTDSNFSAIWPWT